jgi:hypothetical protein
MTPIGLALVLVAACAAPRHLAPTEPKLVWHDEFDGPAGAAYDRTKWVAETGGGGSTAMSVSA